MPVLYKTWADLDIAFLAHPNTGHLVVKNNADSIVRSIRQLLLTNHYERPFHPEIGSNLAAQLFEPMTYATSLRVRDTVIETINNFEPRARVIKLDVHPQYDQNSYLIDLTFAILNEDAERKTSFLLERTR